MTLHVWRIPRTRVPLALWRVARDRGRLRRLPGVRFAKVLGTAPGFGAARADLTRWAAIVVWADAPEFDTTRVARQWRALATAWCRLDLQPLAVRGSWSGRQPFSPTGFTDGPVLALTRARLRPTRVAAFWRAAAPAAAAVTKAPGLLAAFGAGEAPFGWQGTVSLWRTAHDLVEFAYRHPDHRRVIDETPTRRWYAEELFARFAIVDISGDRDVIGWEERVAGR